MKDSMKITVKYQFVYMLLMQVAASGVAFVFGLVAFWYFLSMNIAKEIISVIFIGVNFAMLYIPAKNFAIRDNKSYTPLKPSKLKGAMFGVLISIVTAILMALFAFVWSKFSDEIGIHGVVPTIINVIFYYWSFPYNGIMGLANGTYTIYSGILMLIVPILATYCGYIAGSKKEYVAELVIGFSTDTLDVTGNVDEKDVNLLGEGVDSSVKATELVNSERFENVLPEFTGDIEQIPPMYSAIRQNGKHLYELAREGKVVERKPRAVKIYGIELLDKEVVSLSEIQNISENVKETIGDIKVAKYSIKVQCSKGTYIRTLIDDIGRALGSFSCMSELTRTYTGNIDVSETIKLSELENIFKDGNIDSVLIKPDVPFSDIGKITIEEEFSKLLYNGNKIAEYMIKESDFDAFDNINMARVYDSHGAFIGIYERDGDILRTKVFLYDMNRV